MPEHHDHGSRLHEPSADALGAYRRAYDAAQPDPGRTVVSIDLEAREVHWAIASGATFKAWGFDGHVPGPTIEGHILEHHAAGMMGHFDVVV